jgi:hypothetical protein
MCGNRLCFIAASRSYGLQPLAWTDRLLNVLDQVGMVPDWLFQMVEGAQRE